MKIREKVNRSKANTSNYEDVIRKEFARKCMIN